MPLPNILIVRVTEEPTNTVDKARSDAKINEQGKQSESSTLTPIVGKIPKVRADKDGVYPPCGAQSQFNWWLYQPRRDMYGGDIKQGMPKRLENILYDISNFVIKRYNYDYPDPGTKKVFGNLEEIYDFLSAYLEVRLEQRYPSTGKPKGEIRYTFDVSPGQCL